MSLISNKIDRIRQMSNLHFSMYITARLLIGVGLGLLLATWLPAWTGWIFIGVALVIAIPGVGTVLRKRARET